MYGKEIKNYFGLVFDNSFGSAQRPRCIELAKLLLCKTENSKRL